MSEGDSDQPKFGEIRYPEGGDVEFYDGVTWKSYAVFLDLDELPVVREMPPVNPYTEDGPAHQDSTEDPERG
jgi:hypothetical protein